MKRLFPLACLILLCALPLSAEESKDTDDSKNPSVENPAEQTVEYEYKMNQSGDQYLRVSIAGTFPLNFPNFTSLFDSTSKLKIGGMGTLGYHYFLTENLAVGADVGFGFNVTIGSHVLNTIPILATATFQPTAGKWEFPITLGIGMAPQIYISYHYFGMAVKGDAGAFYRVTPSWSIGIEGSYLWLPHFTAGNQAHFATAAVSARYHF